MTCNSGAKVVVLNVKNHRGDVGPIETCNSGPNHVVLHAQDDR